MDRKDHERGSKREAEHNNKLSDEIAETTKVKILWTYQETRFTAKDNNGGQAGREKRQR